MADGDIKDDGFKEYCNTPDSDLNAGTVGEDGFYDYDVDCPPDETLAICTIEFDSFESQFDLTVTIDSILYTVDGETAEAVVNVSGGDGNYEYRVDGGAWQSSNTFPDLTANQTYTFEVRDSWDSTDSQQATMTPLADETFTNTHTGREGEIQEFVVPRDGEYKISAWGAQGGSDQGGLGNPGGLGAEIIGTFNLSASQILALLVGQQGLDGDGVGGGGGGSFVARKDIANQNSDDFVGETDGQIPTGWQAGWDGGDWDKFTDGADEYVALAGSPPADPALFLDQLTGGQTIDVKATFETTVIDANTRIRIALRAETGSLTGYYLEWRDSNAFRLARYVNGSFIQIATTSFTFQPDTKYTMRVWNRGTQLKGKVWEASSQEPLNWQLEADYSDFGLPAGGYVGISFRGGVAHRCHEFSYSEHDYTPLLVAGGGSAGGFYQGSDGDATLAGIDTGGASCDGDTGGAGFRGNATGGGIAYSFVNLGKGAAGTNGGGDGGFGGGGGSQSDTTGVSSGDDFGGGGGYHGGDGICNAVGEGGQSYNDGTNQSNTSGVREGHGEIRIEEQL